jgi:predicted nucleic acid-binding Zn ribbon protein
MKRSEEPRRLGNVLAGMIERLGMSRRLDDATVVETWATIAGPAVNAMTEAAWVRGGKLYVKITSAASRQELHMSRSMWRDRLNAGLGSERIREIVFR